MHYVLNYVESWHHEDKSDIGEESPLNCCFAKKMLVGGNCSSAWFYPAIIIWIIKFNFSQSDLEAKTRVYLSSFVRTDGIKLTIYVVKQSQSFPPSRFRSLSLAVLFFKGASQYTWNAGETNMFWKHHPTSERPEPKKEHNTTPHRTERMERAWLGMVWHGRELDRKRDTTTVMCKQLVRRE